MAYTRRDIRGGAVATTLASGINSGDASFTLAASTGWPDGSPGDFFVVIDRGLTTEEKIRCASRTGTTVTVQTSGRGADGTAAAAHSSGAPVEHCVTAVDLDEANYTASKTVGQVTAVGDLLVGDASNSLAKLALGTTGLPLVAGASSPAYTQLGTSGLADSAVTAAKIGTGAVGASQIAAGGVGASQLAANSVASANIIDGTIVTADIATGGVTSTNILDGTIVTGDIATGGVTSTNILDGTILTGDIATGAITSTNILDGTIVAGDIADGTITAAKMAATAWTSFAPAIGGTGWVVGNGTLACFYFQLGKIVFAHYDFVLGSTSAAGAGTLTFATPVNAITTRYTGSGQASSNGIFDLMLRVTAAGTVEFDVSGSVNTVALGLAAGTPGTWGAGHIISGDITYQAA